MYNFDLTNFLERLILNKECKQKKNVFCTFVHVARVIVLTESVVPISFINGCIFFDQNGFNFIAL